MSQLILVVDDEAALVKVVRGYLEQAGYQVVTASNGREALFAARDHKPDLIILDLMMPEMDGFEFLDQVRQHPQAVESAVIVVTAKDLTSQDLERLNGGVQRIIQKGHHMNEGILREIKRHLN